MKQFRSAVISNEAVAEGYYRLAFTWQGEAPLPGQFLSLRIDGSLLRRPFALASLDPATSRAAVIYQVRGKATAALAAMRPGAELDALGPLGNSFPAPAQGSRPIVVAGGIGLGPMLFLEARFRAAGLDPLFVYGCRRAAFVPSFLPKGAQVCTDDGSAGFEGFPPAFLESKPALLDGATVYACGPDPFLRSLASLSSDAGAACWVSVEQVMACGVGACAGCAVRKRDGSGYFKACSDGPVFRAAEVDI